MLQIVASQAIVIYDHNMLIIRATDISDEEKSFITSTPADQFGL
jgi:hypothetical protein